MLYIGISLLLTEGNGDLESGDESCSQRVHVEAAYETSHGVT